jgi:hypothetical protein
VGVAVVVEMEVEIEVVFGGGFAADAAGAAVAAVAARGFRPLLSETLGSERPSH